MTEEVVLVVGGVLADRAADEAGGPVLVVVLLHRGHVGVLLDHLRTLHHLCGLRWLGHLLIHDRLLDLLLLEMALLMIRQRVFGLEPTEREMEMSWTNLYNLQVPQDKMTP